MSNTVFAMVAGLVTGVIVGVFLTANMVVGIRSYLMTRLQNRAVRWQQHVLRAENRECGDGGERGGQPARRHADAASRGYDAW